MGRPFSCGADLGAVRVDVHIKAFGSFVLQQVPSLLSGALWTLVTSLGWERPVPASQGACHRHWGWGHFA